MSSGPLTSVEREILKLKEERQALFLAHYYEDSEIQNLADFVGDSLALAQKGFEARNPVILLAGVVFMGESVKMLSPEKRVLVPDLEAGCSLVKESPYEKVLAWRRQFPDHLLVTYVNSSALVKTITDVVCTSSNAEKVIAAIPKDRKILFAPDRNLGRYLQKKSGREMKLWDGSCEVHILFSAQKLFALKSDNPQAVVLAHPECNDGVLALADVIGSTSRLLDEVTKSPAKKFIVATEEGIFHQMRRSRPDVELIQAPAENNCACNQCPYMKLNTLEKVRNALRDLSPEIQVAQDVIERAKVSLHRMLAITNGQSVKWPNEFQQ